MNILKICEALKNLNAGEEKLREELKDEINKEMKSLKKINFEDVPVNHKKTITYQNENLEEKNAPVSALNWNEHGYTEIILNFDGNKKSIPIDLVVDVETIAKIIFFAKMK